MGESIDASDKNFMKESWILFKLAMPIALASVAWVAMKTTDTALLGHLSKTTVDDKGHTITDESYYLSVASYADLWMSSTSVLIQGQVLGMLAGPCIEGGNPTMVGIWLQVSLACLACISILVLFAFICTKYVLLSLPGGKVTLEMAQDAQYFASVFIGAIPARVLANQLKQYLSCQKILTPSCVAALVGMIGNLAFGLWIVLGIPNFGLLSKYFGIPYGFFACPWVTVSVEWLQPVIVLTMILKLGYKNNELDTWPSDGFARGKHVTWTRCKIFLRYYWPAAFTIASDFLCVSVIGVMAAQQSPLNLAVFNSSYRILWMCQISTGAIASATCIQIGLALGGRRINDAQYSIRVGMTICLCLVALLGGMVVRCPVFLARIFSNDPEVHQTFYEARWTLAFTMIGMNISICLKTILQNLGYTRRAFLAGLFSTWLGQVPLVYTVTNLLGWSNMFWLYAGVAGGYFLFCFILSIMIFNCDWDDVIHLVNERSEKKTYMPSEMESLVKEEAFGYNSIEDSS